MRTIKIKNKLAIPLLVATVIIWGMIILKIVEYFNSANDETMEVIVEDTFNFVPHKNKETISPNVEFTKLKRDPFLIPSKELPKQDIAKPSAIETIVPLMNYKITGVVINDKSRLVILEDITNHTTEFLHEGEIYKEIKILKITSTKVLIKEEGSKKEILLY